MVQKLYAYVDESGQDTEGHLFVVAVVVTGVDRDTLRQSLLDIERVSRKRDKKWTKARPVEREAYIRRVLALETRVLCTFVRKYTLRNFGLDHRIGHP